jgi:hypothetical protein
VRIAASISPPPITTANHYKRPTQVVARLNGKLWSFVGDEFADH